MRPRLTPSMGVALTALVLAASGGGAYALAATSGGQISACVHHKGGGIYISGKCAKHDKRLNLNVTGQRGQPGLPGPQGTQGSQGPQGAAAASIMTARTDVWAGQEGYFAASGPSTMSGTESDVTILTPDATTVAQNLAVMDLISFPADNTRVYVLRVNGSDTALACSIVGSSNSCTDSTHSVTIPPDSEVSIHRAVLTGTGGGANGTAVLAAWRATTP